MHAENIALIQRSGLALAEAEQRSLATHGFVISARRSFSSYTHGYAEIYAADLPVYISADSIIEAVHESYDRVLSGLETSLLRDELGALLSSLLRKVRHLKSGSTTRSDLEGYLSVADALLTGSDGSSGSAFVAAARAAQGMADVELFGRTQRVDFSQFKPRGHYAGNPTLEGYFRAMMWLGRVELRLLEPSGAGAPTLARRALDAALSLRGLMDDSDQRHLNCIEQVLLAFMGESDNLTTDHLRRMLDVLAVRSAAAVAALPDDKVLAAIQGIAHDKNVLRSGHSPVGTSDEATASFLLFGQRYVADSDVFEHVTWDRVQAKRMLPDPLDAAFAVFDNDQALSLLSDQLKQYGYEPQLRRARAVVHAFLPSFWRETLYNRWLATLRTLSPRGEQLANPIENGMPTVTATEAWGRRILNAQLAGWAQLRHDTVLYAKQSYTMEPLCQFPDAAVDPYPAFFDGIAGLAEQGLAIARLTTGTKAAEYGVQLNRYFNNVQFIARRLGEIARAEIQHQALTPEQLVFINNAVVIRTIPAGCATKTQAAGWYTGLFIKPEASLDMSPIVADVHTQPTDAEGNRVGHVLHVATGYPRMMVVTQDGCGTPRAYVGLVASYYETITSNFERMTDAQWAERLNSSGPADPAWMKDLIVH